MRWSMTSGKFRSSLLVGRLLLACGLPASPRGRTLPTNAGCCTVLPGVPDDAGGGTVRQDAGHGAQGTACGLSEFHIAGVTCVGAPEALSAAPPRCPRIACKTLSRVTPPSSAPTCPRPPASSGGGVGWDRSVCSCHEGGAERMAAGYPDIVQVRTSWCTGCSGPSAPRTTNCLGVRPLLELHQ
jgi:hypothetical protein